MSTDNLTVLFDLDSSTPLTIEITAHQFLIWPVFSFSLAFGLFLLIWGIISWRKQRHVEK